LQQLATDVSFINYPNWNPPNAAPVGPP